MSRIRFDYPLLFPGHSILQISNYMHIFFACLIMRHWKEIIYPFVISEWVAIEMRQRKSGQLHWLLINNFFGYLILQMFALSDKNFNGT